MELGLIIFVSWLVGYIMGRNFDRRWVYRVLPELPDKSGSTDNAR